MSVPAPTRTEERVRQLTTTDTDGAGIIKLPRRRPGQPCIVSRLIAAFTPVQNPILRDSFERLVAAGGWGNPNVGPPYAVVSGTAANYDVAGGVGQITLPATLTRHAIASPVDLDEVSFLGHVMSNTGFDPTTSFMGLIARVAAGIDIYYALEIRADGLQLRLTKDIAGTITVLASITLAAALTFPVAMRLACSGDTVSGSAWNDIEPDPPMLAALDFDIPSSGGVGAFARSGVAAGSDVATFDNFLVEDVTTGPIWDAYINDEAQLVNLIDSSVIHITPWIPQIVNGQRLNPSEELRIVLREGAPIREAVVTCSFVYST